jgi:AraC-like DNA-binding protein
MTRRPSDMTDLPQLGARITDPPGDGRGAAAARVDVLSEVLRAVRLRGAAFYSVDASSPWVAEAPPAGDLAPYVMPGAEHVIEYHVVASGSCWGGLLDEPYVRLDAGDIIVFPQGDAHVVASGPGMRGPADMALHQRAAVQRLPVHVDCGGSGREPVRLVCGFLACDASPYNPLLAALPRLMHVRRSPGGAGDMLDYFLATALAESRAPRAGGEVVLARLSELMFVEAVRQYLAELDAPRAGWLSGLRDEVVGRALASLHARPAHPWTLDELAREVAASRSTLAERFAEHVGAPPMHYLARWRMQLAATLLSGSATLAQVAAEVGYGSEAAFSRAFKKIVGIAPAAWRARRAALPAPARNA